MRRLLLHIRNAMAGRLKAALDRRYAHRHAVDDIAGIMERLGDLEEGLTRIARLEHELERISSLEEFAGRVDEMLAAMLGPDDVWKFRRRTIDSHNLVQECARAIELLSQEGLILRRDLDELRERLLTEPPETSASGF